MRTTGGESWFSREPNFGSPYARTFVQRGEIAKLWNIQTGALVPKSGTFHLTIGGPTDGDRAMVDPAMHAMPPTLGKVILYKPPVTGRKTWQHFDLAIDTTKLSDGMHKLVFQNIYNGASGEQSGLIVLPFLVANPYAPPTSTSATTTTTTSSPRPRRRTPRRRQVTMRSCNRPAPSNARSTKSPSRRCARWWPSSRDASRTAVATTTRFVTASLVHAKKSRP